MNMSAIESVSLRELTKRLQKAKNAYCNAANKKGVTTAELLEIGQKIEIYEYLIELVEKEVRSSGRKLEKE